MKKKLPELRERSPLLKRPPKDPDIGNVVVLMSGKTTHDIWMNSWVSKTTIRRLRHGHTRHPQHSTMITCASAVGYEYVLRRKK